MGLGLNGFFVPFAENLNSWTFFFRANGFLFALVLQQWQSSIK
jgi:hypothetical protein